MSALVADTHAILWHLLQPQRLSAAADAAFELAAQNGEPIYLSAISLVATRYLVDQGKLTESDLQALVEAINEPSNQIVVVALDYALSLELHRVPRALVPDMPDRIIAVSALTLDLPLVTRDQRIRQAAVKTIW